LAKAQIWPWKRIFVDGDVAHVFLEHQLAVFPGCDMRKTITSKLPLRNGKIYDFKVTI